MNSQELGATPEGQLWTAVFYEAVLTWALLNPRRCTDLTDGLREEWHLANAWLFGKPTDTLELCNVVLGYSRGFTRRMCQTLTARAPRGTVTSRITPVCESISHCLPGVTAMVAWNSQHIPKHLRYCTKCLVKQAKPYARGLCMACYRSLYRKANRPMENARHRRWAKANPAKETARKVAWARANRELLNARRRATRPSRAKPALQK